jgi:aquaporin Z
MFGTMVLVLMGCGTAVSLGCNNGDPETVIGTAVAFGLAVVAMAYTIGGISGCHINPAITLGCFLTGRMTSKDCGMYMVFQVIGAILAAAVLFVITKTAGLVTPDMVEKLDAETLSNLKEANYTTTLTGANTCAFGAANGLIVEIVLTCLFVLVVLGATSKTNGATNNFAGLAIGLSLILIHLVGIHFTGTSVNPARSIGPALFEGGQALADLWVFIVGPLVGGALAACIWKCIKPAE